MRAFTPAFYLVTGSKAAASDTDKAANHIALGKDLEKIGALKEIIFSYYDNELPDAKGWLIVDHDNHLEHLDVTRVLVEYGIKTAAFVNTERVARLIGAITGEEVDLGEWKEDKNVDGKNHIKDPGTGKTYTVAVHR